VSHARLAVIGLLPLCVLSAEGALAVQDPPVEYLSAEAMPRIASLTQGWGELGLDTSVRPPGGNPVPLRISEREYARGLGHHAPGSIVVELDGEYEAFEAEVGVQWQGDSCAATVVFQVLVDGEVRFDSGVMTQRDKAKPVSVSLTGALELELVSGDAGDGYCCDCADWAEARLTRAPGAQRKPLVETFDIAPFARLVTCDPNRADGARASRIEEFRPEDVFLETEVATRGDGSCVVPTVADGKGCLGLVWPERRAVSRLTLAFGEGTAAPPPEAVALEAWVGESAWQGGWQPLVCAREQQGSTWTFRVGLVDNPALRGGVRKVRWVFPPTPEPLVVAGVEAFTRTRTETVDLRVELEHALPGQEGRVEAYNGRILGPAGDAAGLGCAWDLGQPLRLAVLAANARSRKADRTLLRLRLPGEAGGPERAFSVAVDDLAAGGCVYLPDLGFFATREPSHASLAEYKRGIAGRETVLDRVRELPDQTLAQAWEHVHNPVQRNGPTMVSLACDNRKFIVERDGAIEFSTVPNQPDAFLYYPLVYPCELRPRFGSGANAEVSRRLEGGWLPVPVTTVQDGGLVYRQRTFVAPLDGIVPGSRWLSREPLCVAEFTVENPGAEAAPATLQLSCLLDAAQGKAAQWQTTTRGAVALSGDQVVCAVDATGAGPLTPTVTEGGVALTGDLAPGASARCFVYLPGWYLGPADEGRLTGGEGLLAETRSYWERLLAEGMEVELPDPLLTDAIRSSLVRCLIAARNEGDGARVAPWIAANTYGPLESESNTIVSGMDLFGHHEFTRRCLDFFIARYSPTGFLTTGYTLIGTGWQLDSLGEYYELTADREWLERVGPDVGRAAGWIARQRELTKRLDAHGDKVPEFGLVPPGVTADWGVFSYRYYNQAHYWAGLSRAAAALADTGRPGADDLVASARGFREEIIRSYGRTRGLSAAMPLSDGTWVPGSPSTAECFGLLKDWFPGEDGNRSWAYDVEIGAHQLIALGVLDPVGPEARWTMDQLEDAWLLDTGMGDYAAEKNHADWFNLGGFAKVQPYYARLCEVYALQDEVRPFIRSYLNAIPSLLNPENLTFWEHFHNTGAWDKTHETGEFLRQTRTMLVMERGRELWLAPFVTSNWLRDGMAVSVNNAPTRFGPVSYRITSSVDSGSIEARIEPPTRTPPEALVIRLRHPDGRHMRAVTVNGRPHTDFDARGEWVRIRAGEGAVVVRAEYE
jgi:hypothetical protein